MKKFYTAFIVLVLLAMGLTYVFRIGWYPLILVNSQLVWGRAFDKEYQSAIKYYNQVIDTYNIPGFDDKNRSAEFKEDLKKAALEKIIEKIIISDELRKLSGEKTNLLVFEKIDKYLTNPRLQTAAGTLFNLSFQDFKDIILTPQAEREILKENLEIEGRDLENWLVNQKKQANVYLFTKEFKWVDGRLKRN